MKAVLISGASTGIGFRLAERLANMHYRVFAGARKDEDLQRLGAAHSNIVPVTLDVTEPQQVDAIAARLAGEDLVALINNAGIAMVGPIEAISADEFESQLQVNLIGCYRLIRACTPMLRKSRGRIINISSTSGLVGWPFAGVYVASKYGLEGLSDVLRIELGRFGIQTVLINPGAVDTPLWDKTFSGASDRLTRQPADIQALYEADMRRSEITIRKTIKAAVSPDAVVDKVIRGLTARRPRARYLVGPSALMQQWMKMLLPVSWFDWLKRKIVYGG